MDNKKILPVLVVGILLLLVAEFFLVRQFACPKPEEKKDDIPKIEAQKPKAMMLLIEFRNTDGLVNMVNDMKQRNIKGLLMVNADFVDNNVEAIKAVLDTGVVEIAASYDPKPFWEMSYDEQYAIITDMITRIEKALDTKVRVISSRYMASDENTLKIADELGIEYITARGTTELATTIYKPEEYNVKIISVSNIDVPEFKYGSFCDYSFYERSGSPDDMRREYERAITNEKFIGVSHTYIGGQKERWNDMWHSFWDDYEVEWVDLDTLGTIDKVMPTWQIPMNTNAPYTPEKIRPAIPYDEEIDVVNPCEVEDLTGSESENENISNDKVVVFHNNTGPMCLEMIEFLDQNDIEYEEHLNTEDGFTTLLKSYKSNFAESEGISTNFGYYPMIFVGDRAFSGFDTVIGGEILEELEL